MIQETYCSFEQAKALKELGFPQKSFVRYVIHEFNTSKDDITTHKNVGEIFHLNYISDNPNNLQNYCTADRQTLSLVQKWLREEHKLHICLDYLTNEVYSVCVCTPDYVHDNDIIYDTEGTYEYLEGLSAGIDKCIELLKEKKNGK